MNAISSEQYERLAEESKQALLVLTHAEKTKLIGRILNYYPQNNNTLQVSLSYEPLKNQSKQKAGQTVFQYLIPGTKQKRKSRNSNLMEKLQQLQIQIQSAISKESSGLNQSLQEKEEQQFQQSNKYKIEDNYRYFKDNVICFKCNKVGHFRAACPEQTSCIFCFSKSHQSQSCPQKNVCFRCYGFGHIYANCRSKQSYSKCQICQKHHEGNCNFLLTKIRDRGKRKQFYDDVYNHKDIKCLRCHRYGHIDCSN